MSSGGAAMGSGGPGGLLPEDAFYDGCRAFHWLALLVGLPIDQVNYLLAQLVSLLLALLFRNAFHPSRVSTETRHYISLTAGLFIGYFCFGRQAIHIAALPTMCYAVMRTVSPHIMQRMVLVVSLSYLSFIHIQRQIYDYGGWSLDITGPLMVITQKVTALAFSLHDGIVRREDELSPTQKHHLVRRLPTPLEYYSYMFHFQALMAGPVVFYVDYIDFIHGTNFRKHALLQNGHVDSNWNSKMVVVEPSAARVVLQKVFFSLGFVLLYIHIPPFIPVQRAKERDFLENTSLMHKTLYLMLATSVCRYKYYHAWLFADAICNASGLGFNGYKEDGSAKWDLISNVDIIGMEANPSLKETMEAWNKGTMQWLRMVVYERVPYQKTLLTYVLSALWHGFYPGYYLTFLTGALFTYAARTVRRVVRPYMVVSRGRKFAYDLFTMLSTRIAMGYLTAPFVLLELWPSIQLLKSMYFYQHILGLLCLFALPKVIPRKNDGKATTSHGVEKGKGDQLQARPQKVAANGSPSFREQKKKL